ncbi:MAG: SpoVR family protein [Actinomycetia bacterium]|nr:SpoVR family protein [Actinomycetes bacterium]
MLDAARLAALDQDIARIWDRAEALGLRPGAIRFEVVPARLLHTLTAYGGVLTRYQHWSFGKAYGRIKVAHDFGLARMYELVVNAEPAVAYLLDANSPLENRVVVAHVLAHVDFFRHHYRFAGQPKDMPERMAWGRRRLEALAARWGRERLERLVEDGLVVAELLDPFRDDWQCPANVGAFVAHESPALGPDAKAVLAWLEQEARYFRPQMETKIANEGWATFWHREILRSLAADFGDIWEFARLHAQIVAPAAPYNPYALGLALWEAARDESPDALWRGRSCLADVALVERYLTPATGAALAAGNPPKPFTERRAALLQALDNAGLPRIEVGRVERGELVLVHRHDGRDLDTRLLPGALAAVARLWGRPCHLLTVRDGRPRRWTSQGEAAVEQDADVPTVVGAMPPGR